MLLYGIVRRGAILAYKIWYRVSFEGVENIPDSKDGTFIVACNHRSYADPVLLSLKIKTPCCFMAKEELFKNPLFSADFSVEMAGVEPASERFDPRIYYECSLFIDLTSQRRNRQNLLRRSTQARKPSFASRRVSAGSTLTL